MIQREMMAKPSYYLTPEFEGEEVRAKVGGKLAGILGITDFDARQFERLCNGLNPHDGSKLTARLKSNRRMGWDLTFTDEKTVGIAEVLGGDDRIAVLREEARESAMGKLEKQAACKLRVGGKKEDRSTGNIVWFDVPHVTNRSGDLHPHHHVVIPNLTYDRVERRIKALEIGHADIHAAQIAYHKHMAFGMRKLGYKVKWYGNRYDVHGIPGEEKFSTRNQAIKAKESAYDRSAKEKGTKGMSQKMRAKLSLFDRPEKQGNGSREDMHRSWVSRLTDFELMGVKETVGRSIANVRRLALRSRLRNHVDRTRKLDRTQEVEKQRGFSR